MIVLTERARAQLRPGEALVFDWHTVAICCAAAGEVSLRSLPEARVSDAFARLEPGLPVFAHRRALPHLVDRPVTIDCRRALGMRRFASDLPPDFGLRASLGRL